MPIAPPLTPRLHREWITIRAMIRIHCQGHHHGEAVPCAECEQLLDYAAQRLGKCPFGEEKPACTNCPIHCYAKDMREKARQVMRYAGPRMLWHHPWLALRHQLDKFVHKPKKQAAPQS